MKYKFVPLYTLASSALFLSIALISPEHIVNYLFVLHLVFYLLTWCLPTLGGELFFGGKSFKSFIHYCEPRIGGLVNIWWKNKCSKQVFINTSPFPKLLKLLALFVYFSLKSS